LIKLEHQVRQEPAFISWQRKKAKTSSKQLKALKKCKKSITHLNAPFNLSLLHKTLSEDSVSTMK
jgi:hypothetical protein